ncbi:MAG: DUF5674 family protein [bacterium]|nr:DUF5674 family protein [bacterium]
MSIRIIIEPISKEKLKEFAKERFGDLVKAVVDIKQEIVAIGGELHADEEVLLVEQKSSQGQNLWGINLYPDKEGSDFVEFDSVINLKPSFGNRSRGVEDAAVREKIERIIQKLII